MAVRDLAPSRRVVGSGKLRGAGVSKVNFVAHRVTDQTSILSFVEDNWHTPHTCPVLLAPDGRVLNH